MVDPPVLGERVRDTEKLPHWIPGAFPTIFQNESGDPYNYAEYEIDLNHWGPHILRSKGWAAQAHMTFMYWWTNMMQRFHVLSAKKWFVRDNPGERFFIQDLSGRRKVQTPPHFLPYTSAEQIHMVHMDSCLVA